MTDAGLEALAAAVRSNCLLADARHAQELTLCNYLLAMREYFRWERALPLDTQPPRAEVLEWIAEREARWEAVGDAPWSPIPAGPSSLDPFDVAAVNERIAPHGLVYGAGRGRFGRPSFFLGELARRERRSGVEILECGRELVRGIDAAPAYLQGDTVFLRREAFERSLWLRAEAWESRENAGAIGAALEAYGFGRDRAAAIARMAEAERQTLILHEIGEHEAGIRLGAAWEPMMDRATDPRAELAARAVRDLLADCLVTLPALVEREATASLHFWFANFAGLRREIFPMLAEARIAWEHGGACDALLPAIASGREHWERMGRRLASGEGPAPSPVTDYAVQLRL